MLCVTQHLPGCSQLSQQWGHPRELSPSREPAQPRAAGELMRGRGEGEVLEHRSHIPPVRLTHPAVRGLPSLTTARERAEEQGKEGRVGLISHFWYLGHLIHTGQLLWHWGARRQVSWTLQRLLSLIISAVEPKPSLRDESLEVSSPGI